jgi:hypothetical protein
MAKRTRTGPTITCLMHEGKCITPGRVFPNGTEAHNWLMSELHKLCMSERQHRPGQFRSREWDMSAEDKRAVIDLMERHTRNSSPPQARP